MVNTLKKKLAIEFLIIFFLIPLVVILINLFISNQKVFVFLPLFLVFFLSLYLLKKTPSFSFNSLKKKIDWKFFFLISLVFVISGFFYTMILDRNLLFNLPKNYFFLWVAVIIFYPIFSVIPQEIIFRVLFFERYSCLFKNQFLYLILNSIIFAYIHLVFQNFHAFFITLITSPVFAHAYVNKSFKTCFLTHTIGGQLVFTYGLGKYFY
jgi:hypothetical protein